MGRAARRCSRRSCDCCLDATYPRGRQDLNTQAVWPAARSCSSYGGNFNLYVTSQGPDEAGRADLPPPVVARSCCWKSSSNSPRSGVDARREWQAELKEIADSAHRHVPGRGPDEHRSRRSRRRTRRTWSRARSTRRSPSQVVLTAQSAARRTPSPKGCCECVAVLPERLATSCLGLDPTYHCLLTPSLEHDEEHRRPARSPAPTAEGSSPAVERVPLPARRQHPPRRPAPGRRSGKLFFMRVERDLAGSALDLAEFAVSRFAPIADRFEMRWRLERSRPARARRAVRLEVRPLPDGPAVPAPDRRAALPHPAHRRQPPRRREVGEFYDVPVSPHPGAARREGGGRAEATRAARRAHEIDLVVLARYMQVLSPEFVRAVPAAGHQRPPLVPRRRSSGAKPYHRAFERGVKLIGATSHYVTEDLDEGRSSSRTWSASPTATGSKTLLEKGRDLEKVVLSRAVPLAHRPPHPACTDRKTVIFMRPDSRSGVRPRAVPAIISPCNHPQSCPGLARGWPPAIVAGTGHRLRRVHEGPQRRRERPGVGLAELWVLGRHCLRAARRWPTPRWRRCSSGPAGTTSSRGRRSAAGRVPVGLGRVLDHPHRVPSPHWRR